MQGTEYITDEDEIKEAEEAWLKARDLAVSSARLLNDGLDISKQLANRLLEPFLYHKVLISATEWENFFNLRCPKYVAGYKLGSPNASEEKIFKSWKDLYYYHMNEINSTVEVLYRVKNTPILERLACNRGQADIHMMFLAEAIYDAIQESTPKKLREGEWHIPYGDYMDTNELNLLRFKRNTSSTEEPKESLNELLSKISIARCARLSYQTLGDNPVIDYEKDLQLYEVLSKSGHWSPFEHVARTMTEEEHSNNYINSTSTKSRGTKKEGKYKYIDLGWCRNFRGFIQQRALMD